MQVCITSILGLFCNKSLCPRNCNEKYSLKNWETSMVAHNHTNTSQVSAKASEFDKMIWPGI